MNFDDILAGKQGREGEGGRVQGIKVKCLTTNSKKKILQSDSDSVVWVWFQIEISVGRFSGIENDVEWCAQLLKEESVVVIPGKEKGMNDDWKYTRVVCGV